MSDQGQDENPLKVPAGRSGARRSATRLQPDDVAPNSAGTAPSRREITTRTRQYIIGPKQGAALTPMAADTILTALQATPGVQIDGFIQLARTQVFAAGGLGGRYVKASMPPGQGELLQRQAAASGTIFVEENLRLQHLGTSILSVDAAAPGLPAPAVATAVVPIRIRVVGADGKPVANAMVTAYGGGFVQAATDAQGLAVLNFFDSSFDALAALYVKPFADYWERWIEAPTLHPDGENTVTLQRLESWQGALLQRDQAFFGWGERLMGLLPGSAAQLTGRGVKIAIIDSGCDTTHPALSHIKIGLDLTNRDTANNPDPTTWQTDLISHGTHCAGVIAGNGTNGIRGFAPEAEVHILKLFPGGAFDSLIEALVYCIDHDIDVVNCSLGSDQVNEGVTQQMMLARQAGIVVVVAAGNSGGPVQFPARLPTAFCVSALGQSGTFPPDTYHAQTLPPQPQPGVTVGPGGLFAPKFTCRGPEVRVCGPGVAVISSVPGGGMAAWDGTSMGAPHITGLAALVAAHHPLLAGAVRNANRADTIMQIVMSVAQPVGMDAQVAGAGIPVAAAQALPTAGSGATAQPLAAHTDTASGPFVFPLTPPAAPDLQSKVSQAMDVVLSRWRQTADRSATDTPADR